jgi:hypothetical protein
VIVIDRNEAISQDIKGTGSLALRVEELTNTGMDRKTALKIAAKELGLSKSEAYRRLEIEKKH